MAGEVEESFSINFQADSIHSGSISFGRFETEPLCWERRSSFSHNRYLEEVEKCSKPGLVIEKKAYFEAHFKKKGLFGIIPLAGHDRSDRATSENDDSSERIGNQEDFVSSDDNYVQFDQRSQEDSEPYEDGHYVQIEQRFKDGEPNEDDYHVQFDQSSQEDCGPNEDGHYVQIEQRFKDDEPNEDDHRVRFDQRSQEDFEPDEGSCYVKIEHRSQKDFEANEDGYVHFGDIPVSSDSGYHAEFEVIGYVSEDTITECPMLSFSSPQMEFAMNNSNNLEDATNTSITFDEDHQFENKRSNLLSTNDEAITEVKRDVDDTVNTDESSRNTSMAVNEPAQDTEETNLHDPSHPSPKPEPGLNAEVNNGGVRKSPSSKSPKDPARRTNMEKNSSKLATPSTRSASRTPKEVSRSVDKLIRENDKSEKASRVKKAAESQPSVLKTDPKGIQEAERMNRAFSSTKSDVRPRAVAFNFKSSERAERRKEFYLKLEEKLHAKEAEMNQMQAISQEKKEADVKKLRKSLNFKATPMPSFYRATLPSQSHGNKAVSNNTRSKRVQNKPKCPGSGREAASSSKLKMGNDHAADESVAATKPRSISIDESTETNTSEAGSMISPAPSTNQSCLSTSVTNNHTSEKKERATVSSRNIDYRRVVKEQNGKAMKEIKMVKPQNKETRQ